jgi:HPt (histidine-containing phosphotransfer) domain-containing protein
MFLSEGLNSFISKPINTSELVGVLKEWIPPDKVKIEREASIPEKTSGGMSVLDELRRIKGLSVETGLRRVSNIEDMYLEMVSLFVRKLPGDTVKLVDLLDSGDIKGFSILVHSMKAALATIGATSASEKAGELEIAAKEGTTEFCKKNFPEFFSVLKKLEADLKTVIETAFPHKNKAVDMRKKGDPSHLAEFVNKAMAAAMDFDSDACAVAINGMLAYDFGHEIDSLLENIEEALMDFDFDTITECLEKMNNT